MAINTPQDPMAFLEEEMAKAPETGLKPFFFSIKAGEKALIRPLMNMNEYVLVNKHELFDNATKKFVARAICAKDLDLECQYCLDATNNKKLTADKRFILPIYVHAVVNVKTGLSVTYKDQDGNEVAVSGVRLLEMKRSSSILKDLVGAFNEDDEHNITRMDFVIRREGEGLETEYTVTPKAPSKFTVSPDPRYLDRDEIVVLFSEACEPKIVGQDEKLAATPAQSNGKVRNVPDF